MADVMYILTHDGHLEDYVVYRTLAGAERAADEEMQRRVDFENKRRKNEYEARMKEYQKHYVLFEAGLEPQPIEPNHVEEMTLEYVKSNANLYRIQEDFLVSVEEIEVCD